MIVSDFQNNDTVLYQQGRAFYAFFRKEKSLIFEHLQFVFENAQISVN
ncbi:hypothetical protein VIBNIAM115_1990030 [Vibrio nigripulchritudo AM115]|nr:hypothetical protein VIBNIAM115_1990030 [Vibrio nigripulchritudo AM115]